MKIAPWPNSNPLDANPTWNKPEGGCSVAVIGCGPGGMFVCHAVESERRHLLDLLEHKAPDAEQRASLQKRLELLPTITCFEKAGAPGGVWRSTENTNAGTAFKSDTNMYEALWCNGPKEVMEFPDYTFVDHFGQDTKLPVYLPRHAVLDYIRTRVTRHCPKFFEKYAKFETIVNKVTYDSSARQFSVQTTQLPSQTTTTAVFDKVIWSAGQNGSGNIPGPLRQPFEQAQEEFRKQLTCDNTSKQPMPPFLHASSMNQKIADQIKDRHLLLIGGSYSAEDLAFMGVKWGAKHITVLTRRHGIDVPVCWTNRWPNDAVTVVAGYTVQDVQVVETCGGPGGNDKENEARGNKDDAENDNARLSYSISLKKYAYETGLTEVDETAKDEREEATPCPLSPPSPRSNPVKEKMMKSIEHVDVVICCTGYTEHLDMLDKSCYNMTEEQYRTYWNSKDIFDLPKDWKMSNNEMAGIVEKYHEEEQHPHGDTGKATETADHILPRGETLYPGCYVNPYSYREFVFVHNPNLMWLAANNFETPLLALDVQANLTVKFLTGQRSMPTIQEMKAENYNQALMEMDMPMVRYWMDTPYYNAIQKWLSETTRRIHYNDADGNRCQRYEYPPQWESAYRQTSEWELHLLARLMQEGDYPLQLGDLYKLNDIGKKFVEINWGCRNYSTRNGTTFRDLDSSQCAAMQSVLTGAKAAPFKRPWLQLDDLENVSDMVS